MYSISVDVSRQTLALLLQNKTISKQQYDNINSLKNSEQQGFIHQLIEHQYCAQDIIWSALSDYYQIDFIASDNIDIDTVALAKLSSGFIIEHRLIPFAFGQKNGKQFLKILVMDPTRWVLKQQIETTVLLDVVFYLTTLNTFSTIVAKLDLNHQKKRPNSNVVDHQVATNKPSEKKPIQKTKEATYDNNPVILFVNEMLKKATQLVASDIHIERYKTTSRIRFRIDGVLAVQNDFNAFINAHYPAVVTRLKILAACDISESRLPQDGGFSFSDDEQKQHDVRLSTLPSQHGERVMMRLASSRHIIAIKELQLNAKDKKIFIDAIGSPQGMILVTGPTGSGKTTTLYAALSHINDERINIMTVEDPVERYLNGVAQVQVNEAIGLGFAKVLRSFLRQDPEVILVGEMRDTETVDVAMKAAFTGHLVLSTLHTNDAIGTIIRLLNMNTPAYIISASISLIIGQRLVRKNCPHCLTDDPVGNDMLNALGFAQDERVAAKKSIGCHQCHQSGYMGRRGVYEFLKISRGVEQAILSHQNRAEILKVAQSEGFKTMQRQARDLIRQGVLNVAEYQRVLTINN